MNYRLIFLLSITGVLMGFATLQIPSARVEQVLWLVCFVVAAFFIQQYSEGKYFKNGLLSGAVNYAVATVIHLIFLNRYVSNHPDMQKLLSRQNMAPFTAVLLTDVMKGIIMAVTAGAFAAVFGKGIRKR